MVDEHDEKKREEIWIKFETSEKRGQKKSKFLLLNMIEER